ncbi:ER lumen protein retaining receptor [Mycena sp. CBHHK59/15]|nr:ER lumen protein retaining receptor [Mycena sp. CBHHK59/15]
MNLFRLLGDLSHLVSILILLHKIQTTRSCRGISFKTQALYAGVFVARYLDLLFRWVSLYNFIMKLFFIGSSCYILYIMRYRFRLILWSFSIFLESVAILPQLFMLQRTGEAETITTHYLAALGVYRALYIPNWIYRYVSDNVVDPIAVTAGIVQTGLYIDFFYVYFTKVLQGQKFELPA